MPEEAEHLEEFGHLDNVVHVEREFVPKLVQEPTIHQYFQNGRLHRSKSNRPVSQFELFLDLIMVGVVHQMAEATAESEDSAVVARFVLTFWGAWSMWSDYRQYVNMCGLDDLPQRLYTFIIMALLIGYTANSTGFGIAHHHFITDHTAKVSLRGTLGFLLVEKCIRFVLYIFYGLYLRDFMMDQFARAAVVLVASAFYLGAMFSPTVTKAAILFGVAGIVENMSSPIGAFIGSVLVKRRTKKENERGVEGPASKTKIAVLNIEHASERNGCFFTIVLGESISNLLYSVMKIPKAAGINPFYGRAFMVLVVAYAYNWLYFTIDWKVGKIHPIRRHWVTSNIYTLLHWPLCGAMVLASAGVAKLVSEPSASHLQRWYWGGGTAVAMFCLVLIELLPKWDYWSADRIIIVSVRVLFRAATAAFCATIPLVSPEKLNNLQFLGIFASVFIFIMAEELLGKMIIMKRTEKHQCDGNCKYVAHQRERARRIAEAGERDDSPQPELPQEGYSNGVYGIYSSPAAMDLEAEFSDSNDNSEKQQRSTLSDESSNGDSRPYSSQARRTGAGAQHRQADSISSLESMV